MKTITRTILILGFIMTAYGVNAQNTTITQNNDTIVIEIEGGSKTTIITSNVDDIMNFIENDLEDILKEADSMQQEIRIEVEVDDEIEPVDTEVQELEKNVIIKSDSSNKVVKIIRITSDEDADNYKVSSCGENDDDDDDGQDVFEPYLFVEWGMNNYLHNGRFPDATGEQYTVKPWGSWSCAIGPGIRINAGDNLSLNLSADVLWYNFKFQDKTTRIAETPAGVVFGDDSGVLFPIRSKLTVTYLNLQMMPMVHFGKDDDDFNKKMFRIGVGAYAGYRIDSYAKYVDDDLGHKTKLRYHDNYYLENFRYGVKAVLGIKDYNIFASYDLNNLFSDGKGPKLNAFTIGLNFTI